MDEGKMKTCLSLRLRRVIELLILNGFSVEKTLPSTVKTRVKNGEIFKRRNWLFCKRLEFSRLIEVLAFSNSEIALSSLSSTLFTEESKIILKLVKCAYLIFIPCLEGLVGWSMCLLSVLLPWLFLLRFLFYSLGEKSNVPGSLRIKRKACSFYKDWRLWSRCFPSTLLKGPLHPQAQFHSLGFEI